MLLKKKLMTAVLISVVTSIYCQDLNTVLRQIKVGNSLREVQQFDRSESYLLKGLQGARQLKNQYWEAVACENLGLLFRDEGVSKTSAQYFNSALQLYTAQRMDLSAKVLTNLLNSGKEDDNNGAAVSQNTWDKYAGIEVGSRGVKYSVIKAREKNGSFYFVKLKDGTNNVGTVSLTDNIINETGRAVKSYIDTIQRYEASIPMDKIFIAVSSGVKQELDKVPGKEEQLKQAITNAAPNYKGKVEFLTAEEEVYKTIRGAIPMKFIYRSITMDIGSGNTKGGYLDKSAGNYFSLPWGTTTFSKKLAEKNDKYSYAQQFFKDSILHNNKISLIEELSRKADYKNRNTCFFNGGVVWALCTYLFPEQSKEDFVEFKTSDVDKFLQLSSKDYETLINPDLTRISDDNILNAAKTDISSCRSTFNQDNLIAGATLLKGIMNELNGSAPKKTYYFPRSAVTGWISGYIAMKYGETFNVPDGN